mmetsp:Transcript_13736/g.34487  ORF Transcript_13736/g.34487 Transcript_13736/m.34487 type:complete len:680 (+) Transcript_13736:56-2095(+)
MAETCPPVQDVKLQGVERGEESCIDQLQSWFANLNKAITPSEIVMGRADRLFSACLLLVDGVSDGLVFADLVLSKQWPVLGGALAAAVLIPQVLTFGMLYAIEMNRLRDAWQVLLFPVLGFGAYFGLDLPPILQQTALAMTCVPLPAVNLFWGCTGGQLPWKSAGVCWELTAGLMGGPCSATLTLYACFLTRSPPSVMFLVSIISSFTSTSRAADMFSNFGTERKLLEHVVGPLKQVPDVVPRIVFLATLAFLTRPMGDGRSDDLKSSKHYFMCIVLLAELVFNAAFLSAVSPMPRVFWLLLSAFLVITHPPESLPVLARTRSAHRAWRACRSAVLVGAAMVVQTAWRQCQGHEDRLELLATTYMPFMIVMAVLGSITLPRSLDLFPRNTQSAKEEKAQVAEAFDRATEDNDGILAVVLMQVGGAEVRAPQGVPFGLVSAFNASEAMARIQYQWVEQKESRAAQAWTECLTVGDVVPPSTPEERWNAFDGLKRSLTSAKQVSLDDRSHALKTQVLLAEAKISTLCVNLDTFPVEVFAAFRISGAEVRLTAHRSRIMDFLPAILGSTIAFDLSGNNIGDEGACTLSQALAVNKTLLHIELPNNNIGDEGAGALADALRVNQALQHMNLHSNNIGDEGAGKLADALAVNKTLQQIDLHNNPLTESAKKVVHSVQTSAKMLV